ncbi:MAG: cupin domain-containing protein [Thermoleophilia bacterium]|nr:cupin domain-containing protein [Thermoleophilia bacterium]
MTESTPDGGPAVVRIAPNEQLSEQLSVARLSTALGMENLRANVYALAEGAMSQHLHRTQEELYVVLDGTAMIDVDGAQHRVGPREAIAVPARSWRKVANAGLGPLTFLCVAAPPADDDAEIAPGEDPEEVRRLWGLRR